VIPGVVQAKSIIDLQNSFVNYSVFTGEQAKNPRSGTKFPFCPPCHACPEFSGDSMVGTTLKNAVTVTGIHLLEEVERTKMSGAV
jgi:hypothetical protein